MNLAVHVVDRWHNVMQQADNPSQSCKFNFRSGKIERSIASRENNAFVPLSPGKIDLDIELKTKAVHQTKIKHAIFNTMFQPDESEVLFTFVQFDLHLVKKDRGEVLE